LAKTCPYANILSLDPQSNIFQVQVTNQLQKIICMIHTDLFHTVLEMVDEKYKQIRYDLPTRKSFFDDIRALTRYICPKRARIYLKLCVL
jgi:hypothetical protein